jgi:hypothetical protein
MELLKYVNTQKKYALPAIINRTIAIRVPTHVAMTIIYTHLKEMFTDIRAYDAVIEHYAGQRQKLKGSMCMRIVRDQNKIIRPGFTVESRFIEYGFEIIDMNEIDFGIMHGNT